MRTLGVSLTVAQERAVRRLVHFLDEAAVCYQFAGGFAGNLHGSRWPLHDIDIEVSAEDIPRLANILVPYISRPLGPYEDEEFRLYFFRAILEGVEVEVNQVEGALVRCNGDWIPLQTDLKKRQRMPLLGDLHVWVQPLQGLIEYKLLLGRSADVAELRSLQRQKQKWL